MPRISRAVFEGVPYHVTQRGNRREDVFFTDECRKRYLEWLREYSEKYGLKIWAYCLMTNHVHLVVVPMNRNSLENVLHPLHMRYAQYINKRKGWSGHLWQGRFFSSALDESYLWAAVRYVERNPVRSHITKLAEDYKWSSAASHCGIKKDNVMSSDFPPSGIIENWSEWLRESDKQEDTDILKLNTQKGLPCGDLTFISGLEKVLKRTLTFRPPGRPKKVQNDED
ncbi:MAG: transposase [Candidatus Schekmanbacteria bacterium]|nr:transposase [Candidatus Schekmanbacteria bacterium]